MSDDAGKKLNREETDLNLSEVEDLKMTTKEVLSVFKVEAAKYQELLNYYQTEKDYKAELEKVLKELEGISGELDSSDIQQEKDFIVERIRIWKDRLDKVQNRLDELNDEIQKSLVGKWLEQAQKEVEQIEQYQQRAAKQMGKEERRLAKQQVKAEMKEIKTEPIKKEPVKVIEVKRKLVEFIFDEKAGLLKLPGGITVDVNRAKGHCDMLPSEKDDSLEDFKIEGAVDNSIEIKTEGEVIKIKEQVGKKTQILTLKPAEAKEFIDRFIQAQTEVVKLTDVQPEKVELTPPVAVPEVKLPVEFDFDEHVGQLKLPGGLAIDVTKAKGHCRLRTSESDNSLMHFIVEDKKAGLGIMIMARPDNKMILKYGWQDGRKRKYVLSPAEAKTSIEKFIQEQIVAPAEVKPTVVEPPKVEKIAEPEPPKVVKPYVVRDPVVRDPEGSSDPRREGSSDHRREPVKVKETPKPVVSKASVKPMSWEEQLAAVRAKINGTPAEVKPVVKAEEKVELPVVPEVVKIEKPAEPVIVAEQKIELPEVVRDPVVRDPEGSSDPRREGSSDLRREEIEIPKDISQTSIAKFFHERQDDTAWNNYDSIARELEQLNEKTQTEDKRSVIQRTIEMLDQRLTVALTLKNSKDAEKAKKWRIEEVAIGAYEEFLKQSLEKLPAAEQVPEEIEVKDEMIESSENIAIETATPMESVEIDVEAEILTEMQERGKLIEELKNQRDEVSKNLVTALANRERAGGVFGSLKTWLGSTREEVAEIEYGNAWEVYERVQKELLIATEAQGEAIKNLLDDGANILQKKLGEHYKGKENVMTKVWKRLGEMNLYNYLEKKNKEVSGREKSGEIVRGWDKFWANRGAELAQSHLWAKVGAKALSVRLGISLGLLGVGLYEVPGLVTSNIYIGVRTAFVGTGAVFGSRAASDTLQNIGQRWLGKRKEVFSTREEAEAVWRNRLGLAEEATGGDLELPSGGESAEKTDKRHKKLTKAMEKVEATISLIMDLKPEDRLKEIQHRVAAIEAYAYVNGFDLDKDENYQRLTHFRDQTIQEILKLKAIELGDTRTTIRPDSLVDALAYLESRKQELDILGGKITGEKQLRWGKRIVSTVIGAAAGYLAYINMMGKAAAVEVEHNTGGGKITGGGAAAGETKTITDELVDKYHYPAEGLSESAQEQVKALLNGWEQRGLSAGAIKHIAENGLTEGEIADVNRLLSGVAGHREALAAISRTLEDGADSSGVLKSILVQTARGSNNIEGLLQKQLKIDPESFGYDPKSGVSVEKWADHQANLLTKEQHLDDKYFVFNKNKDQFVILRPDGKIELVGKTYVIEHAEVEPIKVVSEHKMNTRILDQYLKAEASGNTAKAEEMLERYSEHFTDQEKVWLDKHWQTNEAGQKFLSTKDLETLKEIRSHGHVYEDVNTGKQYHTDQLDFVDEKPAPKTVRTVKVAEPAIKPAEQPDKSIVAAVEANPEEYPSLEPAFGPAHPEYVFKKGNLSANLRFEYGVGGKVVGYDGDFRGFSDSQAYTNFYRTDYVREIEDVRPLLRAKNFTLSKDGELLNDLKASGLSNSSEGAFLKERIRRTLENIAQIKHTQIEKLFKPDKLAEFGFEEKK